MKAKFSIGIRCLTLAALFAVASCNESSSALKSAPKSVVWIEVDTLRADALGCYGNRSRGENGSLPSPFIDELASEGVLFERAYSSAPWTIPSLATQFSGQWPWNHGALRLMTPVEFSAPTLAEHFRAGGWRTACVMTNFVVQKQLGFDRGFEVWDESLARGHEGSTAFDATVRLLTITDQLLERPGEGLFLFLLLFEPHYRYESHAGRSFGPGQSGAPAYSGELTGTEEISDLRARRSRLSPDDMAFLRGAYQSEVAQVDAAIGELLAGLRERKLFDEALIVFTADHGEELMDRGWIGHTRTLYDELVRVPLVIRLPRNQRHDRKALRLSSPVSQIDLGATVLDLMGLGSRLGDGVSFATTVLADQTPIREHLYLHSDFDPPLRSPANLEKRAILWGVVDAKQNQKLIVDRHPDRQVDGLPRAVWYDLAADPAESLNLNGSATIPQELLTLPALDPGLSNDELLKPRGERGF